MRDILDSIIVGIILFVILWTITTVFIWINFGKCYNKESGDFNKICVENKIQELKGSDK